MTPRTNTSRQGTTPRAASVEGKTLSEFMSPDEVAELTHDSTRTVYDRLKSGVYPGRKIGGKWYVHRPTLIAYLSGNTAA